MFGFIRFFVSLFIDNELREPRGIRCDDPPPDGDGWKVPIGG